MVDFSRRREAMAESQTWRDHSKRNEIIIAVLALIGVLATAILSNWDKFFPKQNIVQAQYSGYRPTGNFETEYRYFFDVSGSRAAAESLKQQLTQNMKASLLSQNPGDAEMIAKLFDAGTKEDISIDDIIREFLPVYQKHFTLRKV